jgi:hypothetical protein
MYWTVAQIQWPLSLCCDQSKLVDVRSSLWKTALNSTRDNKPGSTHSTVSRGSSGENSHHQSLRLLGVNMHSLHVSIPQVSQSTISCSPRTSTDSSINSSFNTSVSVNTGLNASSYASNGTINISRASILCISKEKPSSRTFSDVDLQNSTANSAVLSVLQGSTPGVHWARAFARPFHESFPQHIVSAEPCIAVPSSRHGSETSGTSGVLAHVSAVCFISPYAATLLKQVLIKATLAVESGAYASW